MRLILRAALTCASILALPHLPAVRAESPDRSWITQVWPADNGQNTTWMWGVGLSGPVVPGWTGSFNYLQGRFNQGGDIEENHEFLILAGSAMDWWEFGLGFGYLSFDTKLQRGYSWSYPEEEQERNDDIYGPVVYAKFSRPLFRESTGIYSTLLVLPYDLGDLDALGYDGRYLEIRGGFYWSGDRWRTSAGYQYRRFDDMPDRIINDALFSRNDIQGFLFDLAIKF